MIKKLIPTIITLLTVSSVNGGDLIGFYNTNNNDDKTEIHGSAQLLNGKPSADIWFEVSENNNYGEFGMQYPIMISENAKLIATTEYTAIEGQTDHKRIGLMGKVDFGIVDLMTRAMYDTEQNFHLRTKIDFDLPFGNLTYLLANMNSNGDNHQRITFQTPEIGLEGLTALTQARFTSGDGQGATYFIGLQLSR